jgi:2-dehydropantoate 2-reductase
VCVKAWQVPEIAPRIRSMLRVDSLVVPLCNGVEAPEQLADALGAGRVLGGVCRISAFIVEPGHIRHAGIEPSVAFGHPDGRPDPRVERLRQAFEQAGVKAETPIDIRAAMWEKFLFIAAVSGLGAVTRAPIGAIRSTPETRHLLEQALQEIAAVAHAKEIDLPENIVPRTMAFIDTLPPGITPSMQRDIESERPSELEAQNGAVVRMGLETGTQTPVHRFVYCCLLPQELHARCRLQF